jgi:hypothetical protein
MSIATNRGQADLAPVRSDPRSRNWGRQTSNQECTVSSAANVEPQASQPRPGSRRSGLVVVVVGSGELGADLIGLRGSELGV